MSGTACTMIRISFIAIYVTAGKTSLSGKDVLRRQ